MLIKLSRLFITGPIDSNTPRVVIEEIQDSDVLAQRPDVLEQNPVKEIKSIDLEDNNPDNWRYVALFVNPAVDEWKTSDLIIAFKFLLKFYGQNHDCLSKLPKKLIFGAQTPNQLESINLCICYRICRQHGIDTKSTTTKEYLFDAVRLLRQPQYILSQLVLKADRINQIKAILSTNQSSIDLDYTNFPPTKITYAQLEHLATNMKLSTLVDYCLPSTPEMAVAMAAVKYFIDISLANDPINEYLNLRSQNDLLTFQDPWMEHWRLKNPKIFDIKYQYNPIFPIEHFYSTRDLHSIASFEGFSLQQLTDISLEELVIMSYYHETFFDGEIPNLKSRQTAISLESLDDIDTPILCYGARTEKLQLVTVQELIDTFKNNKNFNNPFQAHQIFSDMAITKLANICRNKTAPIYAQLLTEIDEIRRDSNRLRIICEDLNNKYVKLPEFQKNLVREAIYTILNLGMYMRGWTGNNNKYPVSIAIVPIEREIDMALNITREFNKWDKICADLGSLAPIVTDLPLLIYNAAQYQMVTDRDDGLTINDRLKIIREGDKSLNISSCIRLSSNYLCVSAHRYLQAIKLLPPFPINELRYIS